METDASSSLPSSSSSTSASHVDRAPSPSRSKRAVQKFTFDHSYDMDVEQQRLYLDIGAPMVTSALGGFNGTIFAYGQTGSGKTYTMMGEENDLGIIPLMNKSLFENIEKATIASGGTVEGMEGGETSEADVCHVKFMVTVSYLEIYNEVIKDLLHPSDKVLKIREHPEIGIYVEDLVELVVTSSEQVSELLLQGNKVRAVASTKMNSRSSRSHSCFTISIEQLSHQTMRREGSDEEIVSKITKLQSKINLVDLAGSERASKTGAGGQRLREGASINKSLSALGNVINALAAVGRKHVPYRDSKLTRLLQESLGGNSRTTMIATISPSAYNYEETLSSLQYANRAKRITNEAKRNEDVNDKMIRELQEMVERLQEQLAAATTTGGIDSPLPHVAEDGEGSRREEVSGGPSSKERELEETIANLRRAQQRSWEEKERLSSQHHEERKRLLENEKKVREMMETIREEKMQLMERLRELRREKKTLARVFNQQKARYSTLKSGLARDMHTYERKMNEEQAMMMGDDDKSEQTLRRRSMLEGELTVLLREIEEKKNALLRERDAIARTKRRLSDNEQEEMEMRAEEMARREVMSARQRSPSPIMNESMGLVPIDEEKTSLQHKIENIEAAHATTQRQLAGAKEQLVRERMRWEREEETKIMERQREAEILARRLKEGKEDNSVLLVALDKCRAQLRKEREETRVGTSSVKSYRSMFSPQLYPPLLSHSRALLSFLIYIFCFTSENPLSLSLSLSHTAPPTSSGPFSIDGHTTHIRCL